MPIGSRITSGVDGQIRQPNQMQAIEATASSKDRASLFVPESPLYSFEDVILDANTEKRIMNALAYKEKSWLVFNEWGLADTHKHSRKIGINLYGEPGTGKTMVAHAIAHYLQRPIIVVNYADIESKYVGETSKNLTAAFEAARETNAILFFDEADAILSKRVTNMSSSTDVSVNQTRSVMLMLLNEHQDIILFATNFISNFDPAFMRRILAHISFGLPDEAARYRLWSKLIPSKLPHNMDLQEIASKYDGLSGSDISNAVLLAAFAGARSGENFVKTELFHSAVQDILKSKASNKKSGLEEKVTVKDRIVPESYVKQMLNE